MRVVYNYDSTSTIRLGIIIYFKTNKKVSLFLIKSVETFKLEDDCISDQLKDFNVHDFAVRVNILATEQNTETTLP